jgi:hypothetical protein
MRLLGSFGLIGVGAFAAGVFYSKSSFDPHIDSWLFFAASTGIAVFGLGDLLLVAMRNRRQPVWARSSR